MSQSVFVEMEIPTHLMQFKLPKGVDERLQELLDRQDQGEPLTPAERREAEGLVDLAEFLSLFRLRCSKELNNANKLHPCSFTPREV
jgi:hypothetical protein